MPEFAFLPSGSFWSAVGLAFAFLCCALIMISLLALAIRRPQPWAAIGTGTMCWALLAISLLVIQVTLAEVWSGYASGSVYEVAQTRYRLTGPHWFVFWASLAGAAAPQAFWWPACRHWPPAVVAVSATALAPLWLFRIPA